MSQQNVITEDLIIRDKGATATLARVAQGVGRVTTSTKALLGGPLAQLGAAFGAAASMRDVDQLYQRIARVKGMTGMAASQAHQLFDAWELTGVEAGQAERVVVRMAQLGMKLNAGGKQAEALSKILKGMGISGKGNPVDQMLALSKAAKDGRVGVAELMKLYRVGPEQAGQMLMALKEGPERMKAIMDETLKGADVVDDAALETHKKMMRARRELSDAWGGVAATFYKRLMPAATTFFQFVTNNMEGLVTIGKVLLAIMLANKALTMATGTGIAGMVGGRISKLAPKALHAASSAAGGKVAGAAGVNLGRGLAAVAQQQLALQGMSKFWRSTTLFIGRLSPTLARIMTTTGGIARIGMLFARMALIGGAIGLAIGVVVKAVDILKSGAYGFRDRIGALLGSIAEKFSRIWNAIKPVTSTLSHVFGGVLKYAAIALLGVVEGLLTVVNAVAAVIEWMVDKVTWLARKTGISWAYGKVAGDTQLQYGKAEEWMKGRRGKDGKPKSVPDDRGGTVYDFRGSQISVTQQFAEGFDPGRVASAMTERIAQMGERRISSGFAPAFSYRGGRV